MLTTLRIGLIFLICSQLQYASFSNQQIEDSWVRLGTLWDAPGNLEKISPDSQYVTVSQENTTRLVQIETGEVIAKVNNGGFDFSPSGRYATEYEYGKPQSRIHDLQTGTVLVVDGYTRYFLANERFVTTYQRAEGITGDDNRLIDLGTGKIVAEFSGAVTFSPDAHLAVVTSLEDHKHVPTKIVELATDKILAEFTYDYANTDGTWSLDALFHADGSFLSIYYFPEEIQMIDMTTWKILYSVPTAGGMGFSRDGRYAITLNDDAYSDVQLMDASSGRVLDTVLGSFGFSADSRYLFRNEAVTYDLRHLTIIDLSTNNTMFQYKGLIGESTLVTDSLLQLYDRETSSTRYFDITTGDLIQNVAGYAKRYHDLLVIDDLQSGMYSLRTWESPETIVMSRQLEVTPDGKYALTSNGLFVDVYGLENTRPPSMPVPRPAEGIARIEAGEIDLFPFPNDPNPRVIAENNLLNPTDMYVLGQTAHKDWLYVVFVAWGHTFETVTGWIDAHKVSEIQSWAEVPVLDSQRPLEALRRQANPSD